MADAVAHALKYKNSYKGTLDYMINSSICTSFIDGDLPKEYDGQTSMGLPFNKSNEVNIANNLIGAGGATPVTHYLFSVMLVKVLLNGTTFQFL